MSFNKLTDAQIELLALLSEECGEVVKAIGKIMRHGYESMNPRNRSGPTNRTSLEREVGDVLASVSLLEQAGDVDPKAIARAQKRKARKVTRYLHHQGPRKP